MELKDQSADPPPKMVEDFLSMNSFENKLRRQGFFLIAGVDESGRGALAGPLVAAAVILPSKGVYVPNLRECKRVSPLLREKLYELVTVLATGWSVVILESAVVDSLGLQKANLQALEQAVQQLPVRPDYVLSDGFPLPKLDLPHLALIKGDVVSATIAAASIVSKVTRDRLMRDWHEKYPNYGFDRHKGYGTQEHLKALRKYGPCPIHRRCFAPVVERTRKKN
ncbi:MAG: ribonuclease HII [Actinomycetota bacterium]|nr:ribonuclease HII [Actinomycetota bacterium]